jgi:ATP-dependent Clp protease ATP-binding subunit ClpC
MGMDTSPNFTPKAQQVISQAKLFATSLNNEEVEAAHLLLVVLNSRHSLIDTFIEGYGFNVEEVKSFTTTFCGLKKEYKEVDEAKFSEEFSAVLSSSHEFSEEISDSYVDIEHFFFVFLNSLDGALYSFFKAYGLNVQDLVKAFIFLIKNEENILESQAPSQQSRPPRSNSGTSSTNNDSMLDSFAVNLNHLCSSGKIGSIIGKEYEIDRVCEILSRKIKNNPLLIGDPGVGKTAIVEGLAQRIICSKVPPHLLDKEVYAVDLASMIAGTKYRGQFEQRIKSLLLECKDNPNIILFIDETHTLIGAGGAEGAMDAANILKPALARGEVSLIGATTFPEFKKNIEKDVALTRRFESIQVEEPSPEECLLILKGLKKSYENFHDVKYSVKVLSQIVKLCDLYLPDRRFPDKAIDILDEVGAKVKIRNVTPPKEISDLEDQIYGEIGSDVSNMDLEESLLDKYDKLLEAWKKEEVQGISVDDILEVISQKTKVPKENLIHDKDQKTKSIQKSLAKDIINQPEAVSCMSRAILRSKIGLKDHCKPIGSFLFLGATGVGKSWSAKMLAKHYFGSEKNIFRFDMSEYSEKVSSAKLIGASPGYIGYEEGGLLVESLKKKPHCVLLFDEIEKSHPEVQQLLLQILEEGEIEDNNGHKAYFKDTIVILTSNIGSELTTKSTLGFGPALESNNSKIHTAAKKILSPELINRLDEVVVFNHLEKIDLQKIFKKQIRELQNKLKSKKIKINYSEDVVEHICKDAASQKMGARPLKRLIQQTIADEIINYYFKSNSVKPTIFNFEVLNDKVIHKIVN